MKVIKLIIVTVLLSAVGAKAQTFVGGNFSFKYQASNTKYGDNKVKEPSSSAFIVSPEVGVVLSDKLTFGTGLAFIFGREDDRQPISNKTSSSTIVFAPFVDYNFLTFGKFKVLLEGGIPFSYGKRKVTSNNVKQNEVTSFGYGLVLLPLLKYDFSEHFQFYTQLNFMSLNLNFLRMSQEGQMNNTVKVVHKRVSFDFGGGTDNILNVGAITIGARYMF